jgi:hypothetical protein
MFQHKYDWIVPIEDFVGETFVSVQVNNGNDEILFTAESGRTFLMFHIQDCCESVSIEDICGELDWLVGSPMVSAYVSGSDEDTSEGDDKRTDESYTWTFYRMSTVKGTVVIRWYGSSNGYYSEDVYIQEAQR